MVLRRFLISLSLCLPGCSGGQSAKSQAPASASVGRTSGGRLKTPARLPHRGQGYRVPREWKTRGNVYGTTQLVSAVQRVGVALSKVEPPRTLGVADLSPHHGGWTQWHRSHQNGRDVDLLFLSVDSQGLPLDPPAKEMIRYNAAGRAYAARGRSYQERGWKRRRFDDAGNWRVVAQLLTDQEIRVQWIFVSRALRERLLLQAKRENAPDWLIAYAELVLAQPAGVPPHDDHFHIRIYCPREDLAVGCQDSGRVWAHEKAGMGRHLGGERYEPLAIRVMSAHLAWLPRV